MKIAIDARLLSTKIRGTARYLQNIFNALPLFDKQNEYYLIIYEDIDIKNDFYKKITIKKNLFFPRQIYEHFWLNFILPLEIKKNRIDLFFTPYIFVPLFFKRWKNVITIHDALTKSCPQFYTFHYRKYLDFFVPKSISLSDSIITISNSAKKELMKYYNLNGDKIKVLYHWSDSKFRQLVVSSEERNKIKQKYNLPEKFVLFVSVLEERKNIRGILKISDILWKDNFKIKFVLVGRKGFGYDKLENDFNKREERFLFLNQVNDEDLVIIYNLATVFLFPTFYEGFGLPLLEAMSCGLPIVASDNSSIPEVVGDAGFLGNSDDYKYFAECIKNLFENPELHSKLSGMSLIQAKKFSAEAHLSELINIFNSFK